MISPLLALFGRSLREDTRLKMTYFARIGLVLIILLFLASVSSSFGWGNAPGLRFFSTVVYINFFFVLLAGFSHFASAITEEKEEMTLGLLRMTNLNALSILLGKSTSRVVNALLLLLAQFPFTLLAISLGGVATRQVIAAYCTLGAFIIFVANLALLGSVICRRSTGAAVFTGFTLFTFFAGVPFIRWMAMVPTYFGLVTKPSEAVVLLNHIADAVSIASPFNRLMQILSTGFSEGPFGWQVGSNLALGAVCFLLAWALFEVFCSEQQEASQPRSLIARRTSRLHALGAGRTWKSALAWKDFYFLTGGKAWMAIKFVAYAIPTAIFLTVQWRWERVKWSEVGYFTLWIAVLILGVELAFIAASVLRHERRWKTLSSLAMLPMSMRRIAYQKILGCLPSLLPALCYLAAGTALAAPDLARGFMRSGRWESGLVIGLFYMFTQGVLFLHVTATLSLYLRRGGLPAAIALHFVWNMFVGIMMAAAREEAVLLFMALLCVVLTVVEHFHIGRRLVALAEEE